MKVYIDYDSVLNDMCHAWIVWLNEKYGTTHHLRDVDDWEWFRNLEHDAFYWFRDGVAFKRIIPLPESKEFMKYVKKEFDAQILTASSSMMIKHKDNHIKKYFGKQNVIHHKEKFEYVEVDIPCILVDDNPHNCEAWVKAGGVAILFNYNDEYNYSREVVTHDRLFKATSYTAVENLLYELRELL